MNPFHGRHCQGEIIRELQEMLVERGVKVDHTTATLGFKSMKTAYTTIKGIEVIRVLRKGQASSFYDGQPQGEVYLVNRVFGL